VQLQTPPILTPTVAIRDERFRDERFDASLAGNYHLCLEMSKDRFRFSVLEPVEPTVRLRSSDGAADGLNCLWLEDYAFPTLLTDNPLIPSLQAIYQEHPVLQATYWKQITLSVNTPSFTLIPSVLFRKEYATAYLQFMRGNALTATEQAHAYIHAQEGFHSVFSVDVQWLDWLAGTYPLQQIKLAHQTSALIQATGDSPSGIPSVMLYFEDNYVTILHRQDGALRFCNKFGYRTANDLAYFVLYVLSELKLDAKQIQVILFGEITSFADTYVALERFLPNLLFGSNLPNLTLSTSFSELPEHRYLSLFGTGLLD